MWTFKAFFKKEFMESIRQYKFIMLAAGILVFALLDPIMLKLLPTILKNQLPADISSLLITTQKTALQNYIKDLNQIGLLFIVFIFSGTLSDEINNQKLVFPYSKGASPENIVLAKFLSYSISVLIFTILGFLVNYYYVTILFTNNIVTFSSLIPAITLVFVYFIFNIALTLFFSSLTKKGLIAGITTLAVNFLTIPLAGIKSISKFVPYNLINAANKFTFQDCSTSIIFALAISILLIIFTIAKMFKVEVI
ncbi:ABC transporter permease [Candidatus Clostridium radicumherbarum]|uniref:ABC transporter permease n=1 Tax=Candidatus Clostridium radicumherbarum TaxID=3381662 RepID=A0ABW8TVH4_9CLOT